MVPVASDLLESAVLHHAPQDHVEEGDLVWGHVPSVFYAEDLDESQVDSVVHALICGVEVDLIRLLCAAQSEEAVPDVYVQPKGRLSLTSQIAQ